MPVTTRLLFCGKTRFPKILVFSLILNFCSYHWKNKSKAGYCTCLPWSVFCTKLAFSEYFDILLNNTKNIDHLTNNASCFYLLISFFCLILLFRNNCILHFTFPVVVLLINIMVFILNVTLYEHCIYTLNIPFFLTIVFISLNSRLKTKKHYQTPQMKTLRIFTRH